MRRTRSDTPSRRPPETRTFNAERSGFDRSRNTLDARSLGASRPENVIRKMPVDARAMGSPPQGGGHRLVIRRSAAGSQGRQTDSTMQNRPRGVQQAPRTKVQGTKAPGRGRASRGASQKGGASKEEQREFQLRLKVYEEERKRATAAKPVVHDSGFLGEETVHAGGPAIMSGTAGKRSTLEENKSAVQYYWKHKNWIDGYQLWDSQRNKERMLAMVEELERSTGDGEAISSKIAKGKEHPAAEDFDAQTLAAPDADATKIEATGSDVVKAAPADIFSSLLAGSYSINRPQLQGVQKDVTQFVGQQAARNASYEHGDEAGLMAKVNSILHPVRPAVTTPPSPPPPVW